MAFLNAAALNYAALKGGEPIAWIPTVAAGIVLLYYIYQGLFGRKLPPGPLLRFPILGDTIELTLKGPTRFLFGRFKRYGKVFRMHLLGFEAYVVADADVLRPLLADDGAVLDVPVPTFYALMGHYNIGMYKEAHGPWRKVVMAAVSGRGIQALMPGVNRVLKRYVCNWGAAGRMELFAAAQKLGMDLAVDVITGIQLEGKVDMVWFKEQMSLFLAGLWGLPLALPGGRALPLPGTALARGLAAKARLLKAIMPVMREQHEAFEQEWAAAGGSGSTLAAKLVEEEGAATLAKAQMVGFRSRGFNSLRDSAMTVLHSVMAAADTTRFSLLHTWALIAMSPRVQDKLFEEQQQVIAEVGPELTAKAAMKMPYMDATFKECMRVLPAAMGGMRRLTRDLTVGDMCMPAGSVVWYHSVLLHCLDPALWNGSTDCEVPPHMDWRGNFQDAFVPERWLDEETRPRHFFNFGSGAHLCAGMTLVTMEIKLLLALVLRRYQLQLETPDMLERANSMFPYTVPAKGTDGMRLIPREQPLAWGDEE